MVIVDRLIDVGERLRFHALRGIDHQQRTFTSGERAGNLVGKIHMAGRVDQVQHIVLAVLRVVLKAHRVGLDGDATLALNVHRVKHLILHLALFQRAGHLDQPVGERGFAMVDMGDDGKIADVGKRCFRHAPHIGGNCGNRKRRFWRFLQLQTSVSRDFLTPKSSINAHSGIEDYIYGG